MKKLITSFTLLFITILSFGQVTLSQEEFSKLPIEVQNQIATTKVDNQIETAGKWVGFGKEVGTAVNESLAAVTKTAVDFSETKLGKITIFLVIYKVIGGDIIQLGFGVLWLILIISLSLYINNNYGKNTRKLVSKTYNSESKKYDKQWEVIEGMDEYRVTSIIIFCVGFIVALKIFLTAFN